MLLSAFGSMLSLEFRSDTVDFFCGLATALENAWCELSKPPVLRKLRANSTHATLLSSMQHATWLENMQISMCSKFS